jgi:hypothetical protein
MSGKYKKPEHIDEWFAEQTGLAKTTPYQYAEGFARNILSKELGLSYEQIGDLLRKSYSRDRGQSYQLALTIHQANQRYSVQKARKEKEKAEERERLRPIYEEKKRREQEEKERQEREKKERHEQVWRDINEARERREAKERGYAEMDTGYDSGTGSESEGEKFSAEEMRVRAMNLHKKREETPAQQPPAEQVAPGLKDYSLVFGERHPETRKMTMTTSTGYGVHKMIGETHVRAKLTADQVQEIRKDWWSRPHKQGTALGEGMKELGEKYDISKSSINGLLRRQTWYNLPLVENEPTEERLNSNEIALLKVFKEKYGGTREQMVRNKQGRLALPPEFALKEKAEASERAKAKKTELTEEEKAEKTRLKNEKMLATRKANKEKKLAESK